MEPKRTKRTKRAYAELHDDPGAMFGPNAQVILYPNGEHAIWIKSQFGTIKITAGHGPAAFTVTVASSVGDPTTDIHLCDRATYQSTIVHDVREVTIAQYHNDPYSQAFKAWYECGATNHAERQTIAPYPEDSKRVFSDNGSLL